MNNKSLQSEAFIILEAMQLNLPSPIQQIHHPIFEEKGLEVFIKRDDLIHPQISGNKWRKLKYLLQKANSENKNHLVSFGGAYSNHLLATAAAAHLNGLRSTGFVRGEQIENPTLKQCQASGMTLIFTNRDNYRDKQALFNHHFKNDADAFFINEGGASAEGVKGCSELMDELNQEFDHIFCAAGTATTAAGIYQGIKNHELNTHLNIVSALKGGEFLLEEIQKYNSIDERLKLHHNYHFGGYAKSTDDLLLFIISFYKQTNILLDPVYTGKMMFGLYDLIKKDYFNAGDKILAIHTGGLMGLWGMEEKFLKLSHDFKQILDQEFEK